MCLPSTPWRAWLVSMERSAEVKSSDIAGRLGRLRPRLADAGCEALLVTNLVNVRYLTGFTGSAGLLLVLADEVLLTTDGRYRDQAAEQLTASGVDARISVGPTLAAQQDTLAGAATGVAR